MPPGQNSLEKYSKSPEGAAFKEFYEEKLKSNGHVLQIYKREVPSTEWFAISTAHWNNIVSFLQNDVVAILPESGFIGGAEPGEDDFHLGAYLTRVAWVLGAEKSPEGYKAFSKELKTDVPPKIAAYWKAWYARPSWQKVYEQTMH